MIDNCGYLPAVNELYGSKEGRVAFFNELRERDGWNQPTSVSEAMKREEEAVTRLGSQPERWVASISKQLASHVKVANTGRLGNFFPPSIWRRYVELMLQASASFSAVRPRSFRALLILVPNSFLSTFCSSNDVCRRFIPPLLIAYSPVDAHEIHC